MNGRVCIKVACLGKGGMYANAIMPTAQDWERVFGQQVRKECV